LPDETVSERQVPGRVAIRRFRPAREEGRRSAETTRRNCAAARTRQVCWQAGARRAPAGQEDSTPETTPAIRRRRRSQDARSKYENAAKLEDHDIAQERFNEIDSLQARQAALKRHATNCARWPTFRPWRRGRWRRLTTPVRAPTAR
jgi:hypothetical protein